MLKLSGIAIPVVGTIVASPADILILIACVLGGPIVGPLVGVIHSFGSGWAWISAAATLLLFPLGIYAKSVSRNRNNPLLWWTGYWAVLLLVYCPLETVVLTFLIFGVIPVGAQFTVGFLAIATAMVMDNIPTMVLLEAMRNRSPLVRRLWG